MLHDVVYQKMVNEARGFLENWPNDLYKHDKNSILKHNGEFIWVLRRSGTFIYWEENLVNGSWEDVVGRLEINIRDKDSEYNQSQFYIGNTETGELSEISSDKALHIIMSDWRHGPFFCEKVKGFQLMNRTGTYKERLAEFALLNNLEDEYNWIWEYFEDYAKNGKFVMWLYRDFQWLSFFFEIKRWDQVTHEYRDYLHGGIIYWPDERRWSIHT